MWRKQSPRHWRLSPKSMLFTSCEEASNHRTKLCFSSKAEKHLPPQFICVQHVGTGLILLVTFLFLILFSGFLRETNSNTDKLNNTLLAASAECNHISCVLGNTGCGYLLRKTERPFNHHRGRFVCFYFFFPV